uniref:Serine/threonine-protein kinase TAO3 (Trinotate prediction) n=1 Tax=Henneguya salminicola TaxID=69463 RepID=A0A6G3MFA0_HENSL
MTRFNEAMLLNGLQKRIKRKVQCKQTNMFSAIKKFRLQLKNTDIELKHIIKEVEMISSLEHDNIVRYEELIINNNDIYLRMEYCIASLYDINRINENFFDEETMIIMLTAIVDALVFIHGKGYIHRDIKCSNILVSVDAKIKLSDFGSSSNKSTSSTFAGSPYWMAPELILTEEEGSYDSKVRYILRISPIYGH